MSNLLKDLLKNQGLALESEEVVGAPVEEVPAEEAQEATDEVVADADAIGEAGADADKVEEAVASLESLCLAMESALKTTRGMSARELAMTQRAAAYAVASLGVAVPSHAVSLESIEEAEALQAVEPPVAPVAEPVEGEELDPAVVARQERTEVALEGFKEMASKLAETLKALWARMKNMLVGFWKKLTDWSGIQIKRVAALKKKVEAAKPVNGKVDSTKLAGISSFVGGNLSSSNAAGAAATLASVTNEILNGYGKNLVHAFRAVVTAEGQQSDLPTLSVNLGTITGLKIVEKDGAYAIETVKTGEVKGAVQVDKADLEKICTSLEAALKAVQAYRAIWKETEGAAEAAIKAVENYGKKTEGEAAGSALAKNMVSDTKKAMSAASKLPVSWGKVVTNGTNGFIKYVEKALKATGKSLGETEGKELATA
jgi:hypothetical protein